jgi:hypothetical protein
MFSPVPARSLPRSPQAGKPCAAIQFARDDEPTPKHPFPPIGGIYFGFKLGELTGEGKALNVHTPPGNPRNRTRSRPAAKPPLWQSHACAMAQATGNQRKVTGLPSKVWLNGRNFKSFARRDGQSAPGGPFGRATVMAPPWLCHIPGNGPPVPAQRSSGRRGAEAGG